MDFGLDHRFGHWMGVFAHHAVHSIVNVHKFFDRHGLPDRLGPNDDQGLDFDWQYWRRMDLWRIENAVGKMS